MTLPTEHAPTFDMAIRKGTIVTASDTYRADIGIQAGRIAQIGGPIARAREEVDATGKLVVPGGIDAHVHMAPLFGAFKADDFEWGTRGAAAGGVTTVIDFAWQGAGDSLQKAVDAAVALARDQVLVDYSVHIAVSDPRPELAGEIPRVVDQGFTSFKLFMQRGNFYERMKDYIRLVAAAGDHGLLTAIHCEVEPAIAYLTERLLAEAKRSPAYHPRSRPPHVEAAATAGAISISAITGAPIYIVHLSCAQALGFTTAARAEGLPVYVETRPVYLYLTEERYELPGQEGGKYIVYPPIRGQADQSSLWRGLQADLIQTVASDHSPIPTSVKTDPKRSFAEIPGGAPALETLVPLLYSQGVVTGRITANQWVSLISTAPAKLFGLYPRKGTIAVGADADVVIFDPEHRRTITAPHLQSRAGHDPFEGFEARGWPALTLARGEVVYRDGTCHGKPGRGQLVRRTTTARP
jgi:dihydropyrimidinase